MSTSSFSNSGAVDNSRRDFLKSAAAAAGAFIIGTYVSFPDVAGAQDGFPQGPYDPNLFLRIGPTIPSRFSANISRWDRA